MKNVRTLLLAATTLACASRQNPAPASTAAADAEDRATVVQPSSLSPEQVRLLQRSLIDRGFAVDLTGTFDQPTHSALAQFQRARGLAATGNLNAPTMDALGLDPRDVMPVRGAPPTSETTSPEHGTAPAGPASPRSSSPGY